MNSRSFFYQGDVTPLFKSRLNGGRVFDSYSHMSLSMASVFESQMMGARKFKGNIQVECWLFLPFPEGMGARRREERDGHYYRNAPTVAGMMRAIELLCADLLFDTDAVIVAMSLEKRWSVDPRLEMHIRELGTHGRKEEQEEAKGKKG